jgi:hypothetical protein
MLRLHRPSAFGWHRGRHDVRRWRWMDFSGGTGETAPLLLVQELDIRVKVRPRTRWSRMSQ